MSTQDKAKKRVAVIGYGSQGRAMAQNLRDSGLAVVVGLRPRSKSRRLARRDGIKDVLGISDAVNRSSTIIFTFPDHLHSRVFRSQIEPHLQPGSTLVFLHGLSVHFGFVNPPPSCDVILIAPHAPGLAVREKYLTDQSISAFYAVHQDRSHHATRTAFALARAMGFERKRLIRTTFQDEAVGDLFGEQAVLCGGLAMLIKSGFETLVKHGLKPENAYLEIAYQLDLIVDLIKRHGIEGMFKRISVAARFGSLVAGPKIIDRRVRHSMDEIFLNVRSGQFSRRLNSLSQSELRKLDRHLLALTNPAFERAARKFSR